MRTCLQLRLALPVLISLHGSAQTGTWQKPGDIQKPAGTWQVPGEIQKPGEIQRVKEQCKSRLSIGSDAMFEFNKAGLTPAAEKILARLGPMVLKEGNHPIAIDGYTDAIGSASYNQELSDKRAHAVGSWLVEHHFLAGEMVAFLGYGKANPVAPNLKSDGSDNPEGRQKNRRVEIVINTCK